MEESKFMRGRNRKLVTILAFAFLFLALLISLIALSNFYPADSDKKIVNTPEATPTKIIPKNEITGWLAAWDTSKALEVLPPVIDNFDTFSPMFYRIMPDSSLGHHQISNRQFILDQARERNIPVIPVITDESNYVSISRILNSEETQKDFIEELIEEAEKENFQGWAIDIEILKSTDEAKFSTFIKNAAAKLHENDLKLNIIVFGREEKEPYDPARAHNYQVIGRYVDEVQLMTYNFNNQLTSPGGQTPLYWYRNVLKYAVENVPAEKILVGLSTHGYDWTGNGVNGLNFDDAQKLVTDNNAAVSHDSKNSSNVSDFTDRFGRKHSVWFEDAKTIMEKVEIARNEFGINKFALWRLSAEDPNVWQLIKN